MNISRLFHTLKGYFYNGHFSLIFNLFRNHAKMGTGCEETEERAYKTSAMFHTYLWAWVLKGKIIFIFLRPLQTKILLLLFLYNYFTVTIFLVPS